MARKILVVEHEESILRLIPAIFAGRDNYSVLCARDGEEGYRMARSENPDVILLDIRLPGIDGYEVCRLVKSSPATSRIRVVMMSALVQEMEWQKAREAGADDYIAKPFTGEGLIAKVEESLKSR